jgi:hypothetical protein
MARDDDMTERRELAGGENKLPVSVLTGLGHYATKDQ